MIKIWESIKIQPKLVDIYDINDFTETIFKHCKSLENYQNG